MVVVVVVKKPNGKPRICIDPRPLNKAMKRSNYHMPTINDVLPQLAKARIYSTVDVRRGFWNVKLDTESSLLTTFETPFALAVFAPRRKPCTLNFSSKSSGNFAGTSGVACIADDILIYGCGDTLRSRARS